MPIRQDVYKRQVRDRSVTETRSRLQRDHYTERAIAESLERALRCGYLDDARFAEGFIRMRLRASKGINGIVRCLLYTSRCV